MGLKIVTGRTGEPHVTSRQMQAVYRSFLGDFALLDVGAHLAATATSNDNVRISDGVVAVQGIYAVIAYNEYDDNYIEPVSVGMKRIDTLILHYTKSNDIEDMQIEVVEGEEVVDNPVAPTIAEGGDAWEGTADIKVPIYDVLVTSFGLTVTPYSRMNTLIPTLDSIAERIPETVVTGVKGDSETLYRNGNVNITKDNIGLGNVDNTADTDKPVSNATQTALNLKADLAYVDAKIAAAYHAGGSKTVAELTSALLIADNMGKVYNMSDSGVTTADFVEGAGEPINEGDNVGICNVGTEESPIYKFDLLSGFVDLSAYATTSAVNAGLAEKVDKVAGKGLSTNDYTDAEKQKLTNIESNAQANVQSDWNEDDTEDDGYIKNKPNLSTSLTATGNPITIESSESNLVECKAEVEAVQDLHGYDHPWVGGTGKNLFDIEGWLNSSGATYTKSGNTYTITAAITLFSTPFTFSDTDVAISASVSSYVAGTATFIRMQLLDSNNSVVDELTANQSYQKREGVVASKVRFDWSAGGTFTITEPQIELGSTATSYEPYSNISPIIGQTEVVIEDVGKNLLHVTATSQTINGVTFTISDDGIVVCSGTATANAILIITVDKTFEEDVILNGTPSGGGTRTYQMDANDGIYGDQGNGVTIPANTTISNVRFRIASGYVCNNLVFYPMIRLATETDDTYEPYKGKTYTIQLGDTIYGGELDVLTGKLRVTHGEIANYNGETLPSTWISDRDVYASGTTPTTGAQVVYELATPYTIQLTPQQIRLLKGTNHISCNTGDLSIKYYPDNVLGQLKGDIEKGLNAYYDYQIQALWDKIGELQS